MALYFRYRHLNKPIWIQAELSITAAVDKKFVTSLDKWYSKGRVAQQVNSAFLYAVGNVVQYSSYLY